MQCFMLLALACMLFVECLCRSRVFRGEGAVPQLERWQWRRPIVLANAYPYTTAALEKKPFAAYSVSYIGAALPAKGSTSTRLPIDFKPAEQNAVAMRAKADLESEIKRLGADDGSSSNSSSLEYLKLRLKQARLNAQEELLPGWARWRSYRHAKSGRPDSGSYRDMKTSTEDDSGESLTWLNEFFHPAAFIKRNSGGGVMGTKPSDTTSSSSWQSLYDNRPVTYFDYDPSTGAPYRAESIDFRGMAEVHGQSRRFVPMSSTFDNRTERVFYREGGGACRFSVPFFAEPILLFEEGVHFFVSANGNLLTTSYTPCYYFCPEYKEGTWPGMYLFRDDLNPPAADRSIPPIVVGRDPDAFLPNRSNNSVSNATLEGYSGVWVDRHVYADGGADVGRGLHGGDEDAGWEDLRDPNRQVSVVLTYENVPTYGIVSESNLTAQVELFTNGTLIIRYRGVPPPSNHFGESRARIDPLLVFTAAQQQSVNLTALPDDHPMFNLDRYNSTDLSSSGLVAVRFDLDIFGGHRQGSGNEVGPRRCLLPFFPSPSESPYDPQFSTGKAVDMYTIPPGDRVRGALPCESATDCKSCSSLGKGIEGQCVWCGGIRNVSSLKPQGALTWPHEAGICVPGSFANDYCPPNAQYWFDCDMSFNVKNNPPRSSYFYYNVTTLAYGGLSLSEAKSIRERIDFYASRPSSGDILQYRTLAFASREQITWAMVANNLRSNVVQGGNIRGGMNRSLSPVTAPPYMSQLESSGDNMGRFIRRASFRSIAAAAEQTLEGTQGPSFLASLCTSSAPGYYGSSTLLDVDLHMSVVGVPIFNNQEDADTLHRTSLATHVGPLEDDLFVGLSFSPTAARPSQKAELRALPTRPVRASRNPAYHMCRFDFSSRSISGQTRIGVQRGVVTDDSPSDAWPQEWTTSIGQFDYVYFVASDGMLGLACTSSTAPTQRFLPRLSAGVDDFSTWYLRETVPPISSVLHSPSKPIRPTFGFPADGAQVALPAVIRPGRLYSIEPTASCVPEMCQNVGTCGLNSGVCWCRSNFQGPDCSQCPANHYKPPNAFGCVPCAPCDKGVCSFTTGLCVCDAGYSGSSCNIKCTNGAQSDFVAANGRVTCNTSTCPSGRGDCFCAQCVCRDGFSGDGCGTEASGLTPYQVQLILGFAVGGAALLLGAVGAYMSANVFWSWIRTKLCGRGTKGGQPTSPSTLSGSEMPALLSLPLAAPEISGPVSSAPREMWSIMREGDFRYSEVVERSTVHGKTARRSHSIPCVSEPDVYEPPLHFYDEGAVDFL